MNLFPLKLVSTASPRQRQYTFLVSPLGKFSFSEGGRHDQQVPLFSWKGPRTWLTSPIYPSELSGMLISRFRTVNF